MMHSAIPLIKTGMLPPIVNDYLSGHENLAPFAHPVSWLENPLSHPRFQDSFPLEKRKLLHRAFSRQLEALELSVDMSAIKENLERLLEANAYTLCTGQQIHPFGGPLLVYHKVADTIGLAKNWAAQFKEYNFIPVMWLATDDHDFEEVKNFTIGHQAFQWQTENGGEWPVGRLSCGNLHAIACEIIENATLAFDYAIWIKKFGEYYAKYPTFAMASQAFYFEFFAQHGLLVLNPDDEELKSALIPLIDSDINEGIIEQKVNESIEALEGHYHIQLKPRRLNFFVIKENKRLRPEQIDDRIVLGQSKNSFDESSLVQFLADNPAAISPNALMRPMYQELVLPNLVYIGGPNELAYWLELKSAFDSNNISYPMLGMRNLRTYLPHRIAERISGMQLTIDDFIGNFEEVKRLFFEKNELDFFSDNEGKAGLETLWKRLAEKGLEIDKTLDKFFEAEKHRVLELWNKAEQKITKSQKLKFENDIKWIEQTHHKYFEAKNLAERKNGMLSMPISVEDFRKFLAYGEKEFLGNFKIFYLN